MELHDVLLKKFGYSSFRPGQQEVIEQLIQGNDVVALLPTGMGKSLCYQLPGYVFERPVLIVSPLLSLMQDQVDQLKQMGEKRVVALNSFLTADQKRYALHFLHEYRFIFISPEMLLQPQVKARLLEIEWSLIVADEAHCISQWGFDFRPDYLRINEFISETNQPPVLALSATATQQVLADIEQYLAMHHPFRSIYSVDRANIALNKIQLAHKNEKVNWILQHVTETEGPGVIYTQSRAKTEEISMKLIELGVASAAYHGGKDIEDRQFIQQQFLSGDLKWIVATNAFGMGVHKQNIRQIIHASMPSNVANYMQEIGRAGRDGEQSIATLLYVDGDEQFSKFIATDDLPKYHHVDLYKQYVAQGNDPQKMMTNGEISETAFRVIHYWLQQESTERLKQRIDQLSVSKKHEVDELYSIVHGQNCIREQLVKHFGQTLEEKPENCCSVCGLNMNELLQPRVKNADTTSKKIGWQQRLAEILLNC